MNFSKGELTVMEELWEGSCLDENGEIEAIKLFKILENKYQFKKTSCYTYFSRLIEKGAISRRYPNYKIRPVVSRKEALAKKEKEAIDVLFKGSLLNVVRAFIDTNKVDKKELEEIKKIIDDFDNEE